MGDAAGALRGFVVAVFGSADVAWGTALPAAARDLLGVGLVTGWAALLAAAGEWLRQRALRPGGDRAVTPLLAVAGAAAAAGIVWLMRGGHAQELFTRPDHLGLVAVVGYALARGSARVRAWALAGLGLAFVWLESGPVPTAIVLGGALCGFVAFAALRTRRGHALVQTVIMAGTWAACLRLHASRGMQGLAAHGLFLWIVLRHVSFVVDARAEPAVSLGRYLCYLLFYPTCFGASEVWGEFATRNFADQPAYEYRAAVRRMLVGALCLWGVRRIPPPVDAITADPVGLVLWASLVVRIVRSSLYLMGTWITIEVVALFYGVRIRPNFHRIFAARRPSEFWRAWRATFANWLVRYVYIPLGGNRRLQARNIALVFVVSTVWHWSGIPFFGGPMKAQLVPIALWGAINAGALIAESSLRRAEWTARVPAALRATVAMAGTLLVALATVTLLGFDRPAIDRFPGFLRRLVTFRAGW